MKKMRGSSFVAALLSITLLIPLNGIRADFGAQTQTDSQVREMLTKGSGRWLFKGATWSWVRVFKADGTLSTEKYSETGTWKVDDGWVVITFNSGQTNKLKLPINPAGTDGVGAKVEPIIVTRVHDGTAIPQMPTPDPLAAFNSPTPAVPAAVAVTPSSTMVPARDIAAVSAQLVAVPWRFLGNGWFDVRVFAKDGTFTTVKDTGQQGTWAITNSQVVLTYTDGHRETISLPLDPRYTHGVDKNGDALTISAGKPAQTASPAHSESSLDYLKQTRTPASATSADTAAMLVAGAWKITGGWWVRVRIFQKDGTFTTQNNTGEYGVWKIEGDKVTLKYPDGHVDTLALPLDPQGGDGGDSDGRPVFAIRLETSTAPTPAPTPLTAASSHSTPAATPGQSQGSTSGPFGTEMPR